MPVRSVRHSRYQVPFAAPLCHSLWQTGPKQEQHSNSGSTAWPSHTHHSRERDIRLFPCGDNTGLSRLHFPLHCPGFITGFLKLLPTEVTNNKKFQRNLWWVEDLIKKTKATPFLYARSFICCWWNYLPAQNHSVNTWHISQVCKEENKHKTNKQQCGIWKVAQSIKNFSCEILYTLVLTSLIFHSSLCKTLIKPGLAHLSKEGNCYEATGQCWHTYTGDQFSTNTS